MTKQTNKALWTKGSCLTVRCLIKSKATCLLANFSILYGSVTITTEIMQKRHGQTPRELILPIFYLPPVNSLIWVECFLWTTIKEEFVITTKIKSRKQIYLCSRMMNVSPAPGSLIAGFLSYWWMWRESQFRFFLILKFELENMGKYELVKF